LNRFQRSTIYPLGSAAAAAIICGLLARLKVDRAIHDDLNAIAVAVIRSRSGMSPFGVRFN